MRLLLYYLLIKIFYYDIFMRKYYTGLYFLENNVKCDFYKSGLALYSSDLITFLSLLLFVSLIIFLFF